MHSLSSRWSPRLVAVALAAGLIAAMVVSAPPAEAAVGFAQVTVGGFHTCALTTSGGVKCWGNNADGELGNGNTTNLSNPVDVFGLTSGVVQISAGAYHTCALTTAGGVKCWGNNVEGKLGDGTTTNRALPVGVFGLRSGVAQISAGGGHTCALTTSGGVKCWGYNGDGELGDGTTTDSYTPVAVSGLASGVVQISAGAYHTCAVTAAGRVKCWGSNVLSQLGDGTTTNRDRPVAVSGLSRKVVQVSAGSYQTCALTIAGGVKCWGDDSNGQLGDGNDQDTDSTVPVDVSGLTSGVAHISAGDSYTCAVTTAGGAKCWGSNDYSQLGDGVHYYDRSTDSNVPVDVRGLTGGVAQVSASSESTCALTTSGGVKCWGEGYYGELGDGFNVIRHTPVDISFEPTIAIGVTQISADQYHTCAVTTAGGVKCWGEGYDTTSVDVPGLTSGVAQVSAGRYQTCALTTAGGVKCWADVSGLTSGVAQVSAGYVHACALTTAGGVKCWGANEAGELGDGTTTDSDTPVDVSGLTSGVAQISAGYYYTCAVTTAGGVKCWGYNGDGELGDGTTTDSYTPVDVSGLTSGVAQVSAGYNHACALTTAGGLKCWGYNGDGELGDGTTTDSYTPVDVSGLSGGVAQVSAGGVQTCAVTSAGGLKCWGYNRDGALGDGTSGEADTPVDVSGLTSGVAQVSAGDDHTCALTTAGGVKCWGDDTSGELGDGNSYTAWDEYPNQYAPIDVYGLSGAPVTFTSLRLGRLSVPQGATEEFRITVKTGGPIPSGGMVEVSIDGSLFDTAGLANGTLTLDLPMNLALGSHTVQAAYDGSPLFSPSTSGVKTVVVFRRH